MTKCRSRLARSICLAGAVCSLAGCDDDSMCTLEAAPVGNFGVGLSAADGPVPDDLRIVLWSHYLWGENGREVSLTIEGIIEEPAGWSEPGCRGMEPDAGVGELQQLSCIWGRGPVGRFQASAAGYHGISIVLLSYECDDCCVQHHWSHVGASAELRPL